MSFPVPTPTSRAVITGASSGIGEALARELAALGHHLILIARRADKLKSLALELTTAYGVTVEVLPCDLADRDARQRLAETLATREIVILCNNAGFATFGALATLDPAREREEVELNVVAVHDLTLALLPGMIRRKSGSILIVGSTSGHQPTPANATYAASKAFANSFAESLHSELHGTGVTCTLLAPGPTRTGFTEVAGVTKIDSIGGSLVWVSAERVAREAVDGMQRNRRIVIPGWLAQAQTLGGRYTPRAVLLPMLKHIFSRLT